MPVKSYLEGKADKTLTVMDWPSQSPDLNIIEAAYVRVWGRRINQTQLQL